MKTARLRDETLEQTLNEDGFVIIDAFLTQEEISICNGIYKQYRGTQVYDRGVWNSLNDVPDNGSLHVSEKLSEVILPKVEFYFEDSVVPVYTILSKLPTDCSTCDIHRDYSSLDETLFEYRNIWIPLVDITETNGPLYALGKSHNLFDYPLPFLTQWPYKKHGQFLIEKSKVVHCKAGSLVIYKDRTLHGSFRNKSGIDRPVIHAGALHKDSELLFYHLNSNTNEVSMYKVDISFYLNNDFNSFHPQRYDLYKKFSFNPPEIDFPQLQKFFNQTALV